MPSILKIFVSSPGDVGQERVIAYRVIERLQAEYQRVVEIKPYLWEHEPMRATRGYQEQIILPSQTDIVVCILWTRLGTRLPKEFKKSDGTSYSSGTEFEFEDAVNAYMKSGTPDLLVYRKLMDVPLNSNDEDEMMERLEQKKSLDKFIDRWFGNPSDGFKAAFIPFKSPDEFEMILEKHLRKLIEERLPENPVTVPIRRWFRDPYKGLQSFDFEDAPIFHGRTREIGEIKDKLVSQGAKGRAFLIVYGMSGCGKSSLVKAGVLPVISQPGVIEGIGMWRWCSFKPGDLQEGLLQELISALISKNALPEIVNFLDKDALMDLLKCDINMAVEKLKDVLMYAANIEKEREKYLKIPTPRLIIVVDQMEEIFTIPNITLTERQMFIDVLSAFAQSGFIWVIATMRSDFYHRCAEMPELVRLSEGGEYRLLKPDFIEIGQMIRNSTLAAGLQFEIDVVTNERLDDILHEASSKDSASLPLLEFTLEELYKERRINESGEEILLIETYRKLGGLEGAIANRAEEVLSSLDSEVQRVFPRVFRKLVSIDINDENIIVNKGVAMGILCSTKHEEILVNSFINARLLVTDMDNGQITVVRVAHEALLHSWPRLKAMIEGDREFLHIRSRIANYASIWLQNSKNTDFLLPAGKLVADAKHILKNRRDELDSELIEFMEQSIKKTEKSIRIKRFAAAGIFLLVLSFGIVSFYQLQEVTKQRKAALMERNQALEFQSLVLADMARGEVDDGNRIGGLQLALEALPGNDTIPDRPYVEKAETALYYVIHNDRFQGRFVFKGHRASVNSILFSPDSRFILSVSEDSVVMLWNSVSGRELYTFGKYSEKMDNVQFSPDGKRILVATGLDNFISSSDTKNQIDIFDSKTGKNTAGDKFNRYYEKKVKYAAISPDGKYLLILTREGLACLDASTFREIYFIKDNDETGKNIFFSPDGRFVAVPYGKNKGVVIYNIESGEVRNSFDKESYLYEAQIAFSSNSKYMAVANRDKVNIWDMESGQIFEKLEGFSNIQSVSFSKDAKYLSISDYYCGARIWDLHKGMEIYTLGKPNDTCFIAKFSPDGRYVLTLSRGQNDSLDCYVTIWDMNSGRLLKKFDKHTGGVIDATFSPDGKMIATASIDKTVRLWDVESSSEISVVDRYKGMIQHQARSFPLQKQVTLYENTSSKGNMFIVMSPNAKFVAKGYESGMVNLWNLDDKTEKLEPTSLFIHGSGVINLVFSNDSRYLLTCSYDNTAKVYDVVNKKEILTLSGHNLPVYNAEFSSDGKWIITSSHDKTVRVWNFNTGEQIMVFDPRGKNIADSGFSADGEYAVVTFEDGSALMGRLFAYTSEIVEYSKKIVTEK